VYDVSFRISMTSTYSKLGYLLTVRCTMSYNDEEITLYHNNAEEFSEYRSQHRENE